MRMHFILTFFMLILTLSADAEVLNCSVEYDYETARIEVFNRPTETIDKDFVSQFYIDSQNSENIFNLSEGITELENRKICSFSDGSYGIMYYDNPQYSWYYSSSGALINFMVKSSAEYPAKFTKYKPNGTVIYTGLKPSETESYIFLPNGKFVGHWVKENCFDENNRIIMTRKKY